MTKNLFLIKKFKKMFKCDLVEISKLKDTLYLKIGFKRNTKKEREKDPNQGIYVNEKGKILDFDYFEKHIVALGKTEKELVKNAKEYKKVSKMKMSEYLVEEIQKEGKISNKKIKEIKQRMKEAEKMTKNIKDYIDLREEIL